MKYLNNFRQFENKNNDPDAGSSLKTRTSKDRKSPTDSATKHTIGTKMKGNDGNMWIIKSDKNGVNHWKKITETFDTEYLDNLSDDDYFSHENIESMYPKALELLDRFDFDRDVSKTKYAVIAYRNGGINILEFYHRNNYANKSLLTKGLMTPYSINFSNVYLYKGFNTKKEAWDIYNEINDNPNPEWNIEMNEKKFSSKKREKLSKKGEALPDGSFPIENTSDLRNAIKSYGLSKDKKRAKSWIKKRAKELNAIDLLPKTWN